MKWDEMTAYSLSLLPQNMESTGDKTPRDYSHTQVPVQTSSRSYLWMLSRSTKKRNLPTGDDRQQNIRTATALPTRMQVNTAVAFKVLHTQTVWAFFTYAVLCTFEFNVSNRCQAGDPGSETRPTDRLP